VNDLDNDEDTPDLSWRGRIEVWLNGLAEVDELKGNNDE
jgi:hypothetical protein